MTIEQTINYIVKEITTITTVAVGTIKANVFKVTVGNFPKTQDVKGTVVVGNLKGEMRDLCKEVKSVEKAIKSTVYPDSVTVRNMLKPEKVVIPPYPKFPEEIKVSNLQKVVEVTGLDELKKEIQALGKKIDKIELSPKITVDAPQVTVEAQKPPVITFPKSEVLFSNDPTKSVPVRLTDGKEFYDAITSVVRGTNKTKKVEVTNGNILATFETNDVDKVSATLLYNGLEERDGGWCIQRVDSSNGVQVRFATLANNGGLDYTHAWDSRLTLEYGYFSEVF